MRSLAPRGIEGSAKRWLVGVGCLFLLGAVFFTLALREKVPTRTQSDDGNAHVSPPSRAPRGDAERGRLLLVEYECSRCHESDLWMPPDRAVNCVGCHQEVRRGELEAPPEAQARWRKELRHLLVVPRLDSGGQRWRRDWLVAFLLSPHDLRPGLEATMPRLALSLEQAEDIAAVLAPEVGPEGLPELGSVSRGRELFAEKACGDCHVFADKKKPQVVSLGVDRDAPARVRLAPDLRHVRVRFRRDRLSAWIRDPRAIFPEALMPSLGLTESEARHLASYLVMAPLHLAPESELPAIEPLSRHELEEQVSFEEVNAQVFRGTCWHCHSDPEFNDGDGGPGNSGGFGFAGVGLDLSSYTGMTEGAFEGGWSSSRLRAYGGAEEEPRRHSDVLRPRSASRLVRALRARQVEEAGKDVPGVRGMPLGLPALPESEIRLVERWVAQGALL